MNFDEVGTIQQLRDPGPEAKQHGFQILSADIAQPDPDYLGRWPFEHEAVEKIGVTREYGPVVLAGV